ncbi:hypothetical protein [Pelagicoccus mobilis]|uniref:Right handed beta helix domain-containing protein n=1 Tax=Pelagicoccus mobilis TaxID=415221 RepID=A0A934VPC2_9BACT|nr:hypothetical protein [Pelagicoccus mobilis]MBK1875378.1 hypothetical protein [Pelagicoccus mobilis]
MTYSRGISLAFRLLLFCLSALYACWSSLQGQAPLVSEGEDGALRYGVYANRGETEARNRIPDFSRSGYRGGGISLPSGLVVREEIEASESDQRELIQAAIDSVAALPVGEDGFRGAVLLKAGKHFVEGSLVVGADGIVLMGEGQDLAENGGTELVATLAEKHDFIKIAGSSDLELGPSHAVLDGYVGTGDYDFRVEGGGSFQVGQRIQVVMTPNQHWIDTLGTGQYGWTADGYEIAYERTIVEIDGDRLVLDSPMVQPIRTEYGGGFVRTIDPVRRVRSCGVENMVITSSYASDEDEEHGWVAVLLDQAENCWVKNVTSRHFGYSCVAVRGSFFCTVQECAALDPKSQVTGGRRYSFYLEQGSSFNLFQRCYTRGGRHDVVTGSRVPGPNVFLDFYIDSNTSDPGPHHRYATGVLFDNVQANGYGMRVENRKDSGSGHGWSGAQIVFWNCKAPDFVCDAPPSAMNFSFGFDGEQRDGSWGPEEPSGHIEAGDPHVAPRSLYLSQLRDRLGWDAVLTVVDWRQLKGDIWGALEAWKGLGALSEADATSYSLSLPQWLEEYDFEHGNVSYSSSGIVAREAYLGGVDLVGGHPIRLESIWMNSEFGLALNVQSRLGLRSAGVVLEQSDDLGVWRPIEEVGYPVLSDDVVEIGVRKRSWFISEGNGVAGFFRLRVSDY